MRNCGIYVITSPSGRAYVGSSSQLMRRKQQHFRMMKDGCHHCAALNAAWNKYGEDLKFIVIEYCARDLLLQREQWWIDNHRIFWGKMYNSSPIAGKIVMTPEGAERVRQHSLGRKHSNEARAKMSVGQRERFATYGVSAETRAKLSVPRGPHSPERIEKLRYTKSEEHRRKLSLAHRGKPKKKHSDEERKAKSERLKKQWASGSRASSVEKIRKAKRHRDVQNHLKRWDWILEGIWEPRHAELL